MDDNAWHHVAVVWNGSTLRYYEDYLLATSVFPALPWTQAATASTFTVGYFSFSALGGFNGNDYVGLMDEVRVSNTALGPSQFLQATAIPEPSTAALFAGGLMGLALARRSRRSRLRG
jgi:hypothetical protein